MRILLGKVDSFRFLSVLHFDLLPLKIRRGIKILTLIDTDEMALHAPNKLLVPFVVASTYS